MLEKEVNDEKCYRKQEGCSKHQPGGTLQFRPGGPGGLLGQLDERLFHVVDKLTHLQHLMHPAIGSGAGLVKQLSNRNL